jgi:hypothetical protein
VSSPQKTRKNVHIKAAEKCVTIDINF